MEQSAPNAHLIGAFFQYCLEFNVRGRTTFFGQPKNIGFYTGESKVEGIQVSVN